MEYEYLDHTADAKFRAYGDTLEEAFRNALRAMFGLIVSVEGVEPVAKKEVELTAGRTESLLYDFLEEGLFLFETDHFIPADADIKITGNHLKATIYGDTLLNHEIEGDVKSVTYNDMDITHNKGKWMITVVVDI
ncbi:MAG: archease [Candidatus Woesearchaeota archaeon]